jgi:hypothetical protein
VNSGGLAGLGRKWPSVHGFERGLHRKIAGATGNSSKGSGWRGGGRRGAHGRGAPAWNRARRKVGERGRSGWRESSPQRGAFEARARQWGVAEPRAAEVWRRRRRKSSRGLGFRAKAAAAA